MTVGGKNKNKEGSYMDMNNELFADMTVGCFEERLFAFMKAAGLNTIEIIYSGGGDSGGMEDHNFHPSILGRNVESQIVEELEESLTSPIYSRHGSFADGGGYSVNGMVSYNAVDRTVVISGTDHYYEYSDDEDGDIENERDEDWEETVYESEPRLALPKVAIYARRISGSDEDFYFPYLYSKVISKSKLPEEFHNRMLTAAATLEDEYAERYVKETK
jgi:hypothetical protein